MLRVLFNSRGGDDDDGDDDKYILKNYTLRIPVQNRRQCLVGEDRSSDRDGGGGG